MVILHFNCIFNFFHLQLDLPLDSFLFKFFHLQDQLYHQVLFSNKISHIPQRSRKKKSFQENAAEVLNEDRMDRCTKDLLYVKNDLIPQTEDQLVSHVLLPFFHEQFIFSVIELFFFSQKAERSLSKTNGHHSHMTNRQKHTETTPLN
jgi:hypothetical protein